MDKWVEYFENTDRNLFDQCLRNRHLIELVIQNTPAGGRILEVGCGTALLSLILADRGFEVTALDLSKEVVDYARKRACLDKIKLKFIQGDSFNLSSLFEDRFFDTVCHSGVMEHFSDADIIRGLLEQRRVSKKVIFNVPNSRVKSAPNLFGDERFLNQEKWIELIKKAGFDKVKVFGGYDLPRYVYLILPGVFFNRRFSFWWKYFSKHSIFVCE